MKKFALGLSTVLLLALLGYLGYSFYKSQKVAVTPSPIPTATPNEIPDTKPVSDVIENYYQYYDSCLKNPPTAAKGIVGEYCQGSSGLTSPDFPANLEKEGVAKAGADPIVCAQDLPENISVSDVSISGSNARGIVTEKFGDTDIGVQVILIQENGVWKIDNILCPAP